MKSIESDIFKISLNENQSSILFYHELPAVYVKATSSNFAYISKDDDWGHLSKKIIFMNVLAISQ